MTPITNEIDYNHTMAYLNSRSVNERFKKELIAAIQDYEAKAWTAEGMPVIPLDEAKEIVKKEFS